jgi:hypothetical protein
MAEGLATLSEVAPLAGVACPTLGMRAGIDVPWPPTPGYQVGIEADLGSSSPMKNDFL